MSKTAIQDKTRADELEALLILLVNDIRDRRDREQERLSDPAIAFSEMLLTVGKVKALRDVLGVIDRLAELYKLELCQGNTRADA